MSDITGFAKLKPGAFKEKLKTEGFMLEWAYDRGALNGKLVFRW